MLVPQLRNLTTDFTSGNCFFRSVKVTKNAHLDKYKYTGYSIGFHIILMEVTDKISLFLELI